MIPSNVINLYAYFLQLWLSSGLIINDYNGSFLMSMSNAGLRIGTSSTGMGLWLNGNSIRSSSSHTITHNTNIINFEDSIVGCACDNVGKISRCLWCRIYTLIR
jgi:hypothetical protein